MSAPGSDNPGDAEPRVRDLLARGEATAGPDPQTLAQLAAWFDLPSYQDLVDGAPDGIPVEPSKAQQILERRAEALANVDPAFVERLHGHVEVARRLERPAPATSRWERRMLALDDARIPPPLDEDELPEVPIAPELRRDLKICTPQAFLRDLHRPEKEFWIQMEPAFADDDGEPPPLDPMAPVRETVRRDYRVGTTVTPAAAEIAASWSDLRGILAMPWPDARRDKARRREEELLGKEAGAASVPGEPEGSP